MQLPDLQHLSVCEHAHTAWADPCLPHRCVVTPGAAHFPATSGHCLHATDSSSSDPSAALQPLQALTRLADLQLGSDRMPECDVTADTLSGADQLTRLVLSGQLFEPRALAGKSQLQHLTLEALQVGAWGRCGTAAV